jgi:hypothetical protein
MNSHGNRARLGGVLVAVAAVLALVALPGLATGHGNHHDDLADAGTIQSFDGETGVLVIDLADGGSVSGLVAPRTHIHCDNGHHRGHHGLGHGKTGKGKGQGKGASASRSGRCTADDLDPGTTVKLAVLVLADGKAIYKLIALPKPDEDEEEAAPAV